MDVRRSLGAVAGVGLAVSLAAPAAAQPAQCCQAPNWFLAVNYGSPQSEGYWHINMMGRNGVLIGLSPVAARVRLSDGTVRTFSISHGQFERLTNFVGREISFDVRHDVLQFDAA